MKAKHFMMLAISLSVAAAAAGGYFYMVRQIKVSIAEGLRPHALPSVDLKMWAKLSSGMTKTQVTSLLGEAPWGMVLPGNTEIWEYGYSFGIAPVEHPRAYLIRFDDHGVVTSFRAPEPSKCDLPTTKA